MTSACNVCAIGRYQPNTDQTDCIDCEAGKYQDTVQQTTCKECVRGTYLSTVRATSSSSCINCALGKYSSTLAATSSSACYNCGLGKYSDNQPASGEHFCKRCPRGSYNDQTGQAACKFCPQGTFADLWGIYGVGLSVNICTDCGKGRYNDQTGRCVMSLYGDAHPCVQAGSASAGSGQICKNCGVGRYSTSNRGTSESVCINCAAGKYSNLERASGSCTDCSAGYYSNTGANSCTACGIGTYSSSGAASCSFCDAGQFNNEEGQSSCKDCGVGKYSSWGASTCSNCQSGKYQNQVGRNVCKDCSAGKASDTVAATTESTCVSCNAGYYSGSGATTCSNCQTGKYQNNGGQSSCKDCSAGKASNTVAAPAESTCVSCNAGYYQPSSGSTSCILCGVGQYQANTGETACNSCGTGKSVSLFDIISAAGIYYDYAIDFETCQAITQYIGEDVGTVSYNDIPYGCVKCAHGLCNNAAGWNSYLFNTYAPAKSIHCQGTWYHNGCVKLTAVGIQFKVNNYVPDSDGICTLCNPGQYSDVQLAFSCKDCQPGKAVGSSGAYQCEPCGVGKYADSSALTQCKDCVYGQYSDGIEASSCKVCPTGRKINPSWSQSLGSIYLDHSCTLCTPGFYTSLVGQYNCQGCAYGQFQASSGQSGCNLCIQGQYNDASNQASCKLCPRGRFTQSYGSQSISNCDNCPQGQYNDLEGQSICKVCAAGRFMASAGATQCQPCPNGRYGTGTGQISCQLCGAGYRQKTAVTSGASTVLGACDGCGNGYYQDLHNQQHCKACDVGKYTDTNINTACKHCPQGRYQNHPHQSSCNLCHQGQYADGVCPNTQGCGSKGTRTSCKLCPSGRHQNELGSAGCKDCVPGKYNHVNTGLAVCKNCPAAQYQPSNAGTSCNWCYPGQFSDVDGMGSCKNCPAGKFSYWTRKTSCDICPVGQYQDLTGRWDCKNCPSGQFSNSFGEIMGISTEQTEAALISSSLSCVDCADLDISWYYYELPSNTQGCSQSYIDDDTYGNDIEASMGEDGPYTEFTATPVMINDQHYVVVHGGKSRDGVVLGQSWTYDVAAQAYLSQGTHASGKPTIYSTDAPTTDPDRYNTNWICDYCCDWLDPPNPCPRPPRRAIESDLGARFAHSTVYIPLINLLVVVGGKSDDSTWYNMEQVLFANPSTSDVNFRHCIYGDCTTHVNALTISERKGFVYYGGQDAPTPPEARTYPALSAHPDKTATHSYQAVHDLPCDTMYPIIQPQCDCRDSVGTMFYMYGGYGTDGSVLDDLWEVYQQCSREYTNYGNSANYWMYVGSTYWQRVTSATGHAIEHPIGRNIVVHDVFQASNGVEIMSYNVIDDTSSVGVLTTDSNPYINVLPGEVTWDTSDITIDSCPSDNAWLCQNPVPSFEPYSSNIVGDLIRLPHIVYDASECFRACRDESDCRYFGIWDFHSGNTWCTLYHGGTNNIDYLSNAMYKMTSTTGSFTASCCKTTFKYFPVFLEDKILAISRTYDGGTGNHRYVHASSNKHPVTFMEYEINDVSVDPTTLTAPENPCTSAILTVDGGMYPNKAYTRLYFGSTLLVGSGWGKRGSYTQEFCFEPGTYTFQGRDDDGRDWRGGYAKVEGLPGYYSIMPVFNTPGNYNNYNSVTFTITEQPPLTDFYIGFDFRMVHETYRPVHGGTLVSDVGYVLVNNGQVFVASSHCPDCDQNLHSRDSIVECTGNNQPRGCYECPAGKYVSVPTNDMDRVTCENCADRTYQDEIGKFSCKEPVAGTCGGGECCPVTSVVNNVATTSCTTCGAGRYSADGLYCVSCPAGQYQDGNGATSCKECGCGHYTNTLTGIGATSCTKCTGNTYTSNSRTACATCAAGKWARESQCGCDFCPKGKYYGSSTPGLSDACEFCPPGKHGDNIYGGLTSASQCVNCPNGKYGGDREQNGVAYTPVYEDEYDCHYCPNGRAIANVEGASKWYEACFPCGHSPYHSNEHCNTRCGFGSWPRVGAVTNGVQGSNGIHCYDGGLGFCCYRI